MAPGSRAPRKVRKQYTNSSHPLVVLRFEDGHEIKIYRGSGKSFDAWSGETVKVLAVNDPTSDAVELLESRKSDDFDDEVVGGGQGGAP
jgi:hypothetical protein